MAGEEENIDPLVLGDEPVETEDGKVDVPNAPASVPSQLQEVDTETWQGVYVDFAVQNPNIAVDDAYTGEGGFLGDVDSPEAYCYITPKLTENFYKTRVKLGVYFNQFKPYIDAKVVPIFALGVKDNVREGAGEDYLEEDKWLDVVDDATGTGKDLNELREESGVLAWTHDVSYWVADKVYDRVIYYIKSAKDVDCYQKDTRTKKLISITFWEESFIDDSGTEIFVKHEHTVEEDGRGVVIVYHGKVDRRRSDNYKFEEVDRLYTGLNVLNVYAMFAEPAAIGDYKPHRPKSYSIARIVHNLYNLITVLNYVMFKQGHGLYVFQGKVHGLRDALSNIAEIPANEPNGKSYNMPTILTPDPDMPRVHLEIIEKFIGFMLGMMGNNGVTVVGGSKTAESGLSKAFDMVGTVDTYKRSIKMFQRADKWIKEIFNIFEGRTESNYTYETEYPKEFFPTDNVDVLDLVELAEKYNGMDLNKVAAEIYREVVKRVLKDSPRDRVQEMLDEIEDLIGANDDTGKKNKPPKSDPVVNGI